MIKLDMSLTRNIDQDRARAALAGALTIFGRSIGAEVVAEGVETIAELDAMRRIGVTKVQGYLLGSRSRSKTHGSCNPSRRSTYKPPERSRSGSPLRIECAGAQEFVNRGGVAS